MRVKRGRGSFTRRFAERNGGERDCDVLPRPISLLNSHLYKEKRNRRKNCCKIVKHVDSNSSCSAAKKSVDLKYYFQ